VLKGCARPQKCARKDHRQASWWLNIVCASYESVKLQATSYNACFIIPVCLDWVTTANPQPLRVGQKMGWLSNSIRSIGHQYVWLCKLMRTNPPDHTNCWLLVYLGVHVCIMCNIHTTKYGGMPSCPWCPQVHRMLAHLALNKPITNSWTQFNSYPDADDIMCHHVAVRFQASHQVLCIYA